ncbi:hypothetical protein pdam_00020018 [Pocillopora damicornis]|uniref:G-protein coupled receptors family 1 profile domain-containing protein n=1 Tax=Pocillopora damicornis TaxID=46731 RepID=A0A3M6UWH1_POCDA|nr:hypothetical protein pdam_00020018 [Pocillopora damicornis]
MSYGDVCKIHSHSQDGQSGFKNIVIINCIINAALLLISILGNGLVLTAVIRTPCIRTTSMKILSNLFFSDFLVGLITQPLYIAKELTRDRCLDIFWDTVAYSFCGVSLLIITAISVDRFLALHLHMQYAAVMTKSRINSAIAIIWLGNFLSFVNTFVFFCNLGHVLSSNVHFINSPWHLTPALVGRMELCYNFDIHEFGHISISVLLAFVRSPGTKNETSTFEGSGNPNTFAFINGILNAPLMLSSIIGNALVFGTILATPSLRSSTTVLLCSLALSDLLVALVVQPLYIAKQLDIFNRSRLVEIMEFALCGVSLCTVTAVSVDRFAALHYHMRYPTVVTVQKVLYISGLIWLGVGLLSGFYFWSKYYFYLGVSISICICLIFSSYSYYRIFRVVRQHHIQIQVQQHVMESVDLNVTSMLRLQRSAVNTFVFYFAIIVCYLPLLVSLSLNFFSKKLWSKVWELADTVVFLNSSINPVLYCWRLTELRIAT